MAQVDLKQLPSKGKPWSTLLAQDFIHKLDLILPQEAAERFRLKLAQEAYSPTYYRVIMKLGDILDGEFFTQYIKVGSIVMLSEGNMGRGNVFTLKDGTLTMFLEKETYERAGLVGQPHGVKGNRGLKPRWIVQYDLRTPASFPGKKGYDRLLYACKNVFDTPMTWMFHCQSVIPDPDPLANHFPIKYTSTPSLLENISAITPSLEVPESVPTGLERVDFEEFSTNVYEWLSLVRLQSPRIEAGDSVDPFLSRYCVSTSSEETHHTSLCKISWQGFITPGWARQVLADMILSLPERSWFSFSATSFGKGLNGDSSDCTVLRPPNSTGEYVLWDVHGHE